MGWVVQSFAEVELPAPWTSYKGIGSIVCFLNHHTNKTTWKHPFYDYFFEKGGHIFGPGGEMIGVRLRGFQN